MKKIEVLILSTLVLLLSLQSQNLVAQSETISVGGKASGQGGTVEYSIGQVVYGPTASEDLWTISQGLQQPYIIQAITALENSDIGLSYKVYPNPTRDFILLNIDKENTFPEGSFYSIFDVEGQLIKDGEIRSRETLIPMKELQDGTYLIKAFLNNEEVKVFRIIKN